MKKRQAPAAKAEMDIIDRIISGMPKAPDVLHIDAVAVERLVGALQEFVALVQPAMQRRTMRHEALRLDAGRAGTKDWLQRVVAGTAGR